MAMIARPDLPAHHPQNTPLRQWRDGWLKLSVAAAVSHRYLTMSDPEKAERNLPASREEMIKFLIDKNEIPKAGIGTTQ